MHNRLYYLDSISETGIGKALLAKLRRGLGKEPGDIPEVWGAFLEDIPEELLGKNGNPSAAEDAVYHALTLFALHHQGTASAGNVFVDGQSLGRAVGKLALLDDSGDSSRIEKKLEYAARASSLRDLVIRLRSLVQLLKAKGIGLDYCRLAEDLYRFSFEEDRRNVRLQWGRDFFNELKKDKLRGEIENEK